MAPTLGPSSAYTITSLVGNTPISLLTTPNSQNIYRKITSAVGRRHADAPRTYITTSTCRAGKVGPPPVLDYSKRNCNVLLDVLLVVHFNWDRVTIRPFNPPTEVGVRWQVEDAVSYLPIGSQVNYFPGSTAAGCWSVDCFTL